MQRLFRGYEGIFTEVPWCVLRSPTIYYAEGMPAAGEAYRAHTARPLNRMCHNQEAVVRRVCYHAVAEVQKDENMCPRFVWHRRRRLATGRKERMWRVLQMLLPGEEYMLATNRTCGRRGPFLVLGVDFGRAAHATVRWVMKEGVSLEVLHVRRKDITEYRKAGLHHAEFYRDQGVVECSVYRWVMRRARGQEAGTSGCERCGRNAWRNGGSRGRNQDAGEGQEQYKRRCWTAEEETRPARVYCFVQRWESRGRGGRYKVRADSGTMSMRICSGETTSWWGQDRGTSAGDAPRRRGWYRGRC